MTRATAHPKGTDERHEASRLPASEQPLPTLPTFETAQLATMRSRASSTRGAWNDASADTIAEWLRLDE